MSHSCRRPPSEDQLPSTGEENKSWDLSPERSKTVTQVVSHDIATQALGNIDELSFPEGGKHAWLAVVGAFFACFAAFEMTNAIGAFQNWVMTHQLRDESASAIGWLFGVNSFVLIFCGLFVGPPSDIFGMQIPLRAGAVLCVVFYVVLGYCHEYWHFMLAVGVLAGLASSLLFVPSIVTVGQYFARRRGVATGLALSGGSIGGIVVPIMLEILLPRIGWVWTTRLFALLTLVLGALACLLVRPRLAPTQTLKGFTSMLPDFSTYREGTFFATSFGIFFLDTALFIPLAYLPTYTTAQGFSTSTAYSTLVYLNVGSCLGRWIPAAVSDRIGRFNTMMITVSLCAICTLTTWLSVGSSLPGIIIYAVFFGFASGSNLSLAPVCVGQLCDIKSYARYYTTAVFLASFGYVEICAYS
ncbi:hypothetical protein CLAIMM_04687 [Cladophialophora immunda]|nr:hypothetical protein CLAIMM_04687 [Cladophialophora immunda]